PARERLGTFTRQGAIEIVMRAAQEDVRVGAVAVEVASDGPDAGAVIVTLRTDVRPRMVVTRDLRDQLQGLAAADPEGPLHLEVARPPTHKVLARAEGVPGFGWSGWAPGETAAEPVQQLHGDADHPWRMGLANGLLTVEVDRTDGTWSIDGLTGFGRLVDDGDAGDTYNWSPPAIDVVVDRPEAVRNAAVLQSASGPVRGQVLIRTAYRLPAAVAPGPRDDPAPGRRLGGAEVVLEVATTLELRAGEDFLRVSVELDNQAQDHRLRVWFPLPEPADRSTAECAFGTVDRGLVAEGGPTEVGLATYPSRRFVVAGGLTVVHEGLTEYELVDIEGDGEAARAHSLAVTLLRCTGLISNGPMAMRPVPAGPPTPTPDAQMAGRQRFTYALHVGGRAPYDVADDVLVPLQVARHRGSPPLGDGAASGQALAVTGAEVSAVARVDGRLEVRVFNPTDAETTVRFDGRTGWLVDLRGRAQEPFAGSFPLRARGIQTVTLHEEHRAEPQASGNVSPT
ncbi:MAG TPA: hypothetical protein VGM93_12715, partial [Acidimicrobiales bacterium]